MYLGATDWKTLGMHILGTADLNPIGETNPHSRDTFSISEGHCSGIKGNLICSFLSLFLSCLSSFLYPMPPVGGDCFIVVFGVFKGSVI